MAESNQIKSNEIKSKNGRLVIFSITSRNQ
jgi:hypothetical protein